MSEENPKENNGARITAEDLFGSIPKPIDYDPFEGIDMGAINVRTVPSKVDAEDEENFEINRFEGFDIGDISGALKRDAEGWDGDGLISLGGIDTGYIGIRTKSKHKRGQLFRRPRSAPFAKSVEDPSLEKPLSQEIPTDASTLKGRSKIDHVWAEISKVGKSLTTALKPSHKFPPKTSLKKTPAGDSSLTGRLRSAYVYSEINRIRENIVGTLEKEKKKTVVFTAPHDDAGTTFLLTIIAFNVAYFTSLKTLLVDLNMRRPQLHVPFGLKREGGFTEIAAGTLKWAEAVKDTGLAELKVVTAGLADNELHLTLTSELVENMINEMKEDFDLIMFDSSPLLNKNKNNVDPVLLSRACEMVVMVVQDKMTTKAVLVEAVDTIKDGGGEIYGIVYNKQF